ncbi:hypothetical protein WJX82_010157 [Trebouxia sp. C0006]
MSELVQTNLHRLINKSQKRRSAPHEDEPCPVLKRPSLLTRLADSSDQSQPHSKVMVLGGTHNDIQATVSHGRRSKRHQIRAFDHYSNGGGTWDSDMVGLDGLTEPDSTWEGRGVISLGR